jgi:hypothetical protein
VKESKKGQEQAARRRILSMPWKMIGKYINDYNGLVEIFSDKQAKMKSLAEW